MHLVLYFLLAVPEEVRRSIRLVNVSGRALLVGESDSARLTPARSVPPGQPPVLSFRYMEGERRHRFGDMDLVVDDAGH